MGHGIAYVCVCALYAARWKNSRHKINVEKVHKQWQRIGIDHKN